MSGFVDKWFKGLATWKATIQRSSNPLFFLFCILAASLLSSCAGYKLGPTNGVEAGQKTIQITPFLNHTLEPRLGDAVTTALRLRIQRDGTYRLATHGDADLIVTGVLTHYERYELNLQPNDVLTVQDYRVNVTAKITLRDVNAGTTMTWTNTGYTLVRVGSDLTSSERQAMPVLAEDLATHVTDSLVDGTW